MQSLIDPELLNTQQPPNNVLTQVGVHKINYEIDRLEKARFSMSIFHKLTYILSSEFLEVSYNKPNLEDNGWIWLARVPKTNDIIMHIKYNNKRYNYCIGMGADFQLTVSKDLVMTSTPGVCIWVRDLKPFSCNMLENFVRYRKHPKCQDATFNRLNLFLRELAFEYFSPRELLL
jgi:hypothetical protein